MLTSADKRRLRQQAHHLKPVVLVGQHGLAAPVLAEIDRALDDHELIKVRFRGADRDARKAAFMEMAATLEADLVGHIGGVATLYRQNPDKR